MDTTVSTDSSLKPSGKVSSALRLQQVLQGIIALFFTAAGLANLAGGMGADMLRLGYPEYFSMIIGGGYLIGVVCIYQRVFPFLQDWAFGAMAASLVGAAASHIFVGDPLSKVLPCFIIQILFVWSYVLRMKGQADVA
ncbi:MAG: DoxX family protein [Pseudomonadota bacterium]